MLPAAMAGAVYALLVFIPGWDNLTGFVIKVPVAAMMLFTAFGFVNIRGFFRYLFIFLLASFLLGGIALGLAYLLKPTVMVQANNGLTQGGFSKWTVLSCTLLTAYLIGRWGPIMLFKRVQQQAHRIPVTVTFWGKQVSVQALVDTGNQLIDPLNQHPVVIVEFAVLKPVLPPRICELFLNSMKQDGSKMILSLANTPYAKRLRVIPFQSLGREKGMLLGIRPDALEIQCGNQKRIVKDVVVGIYSKQLSPESAYRALLHPQLLAS